MVFRFGGQRSPDKVTATASPLNKKGQLRLPSSHKKGQPRPLTSPHPLEAHGSGLEAHGSGIERAIPAELPPGEYVVTVFLTVQQSDVDYFFRVMVT
jgi:hypothetical protein